jgi:hypothetical protein
MIILVAIIGSALSVSAAETLDQEQTSGGDPYFFYDRGHDWAKQEFTPTMNLIAKVRLYLGVDYGMINPCSGYYATSEEFNVEIRDSSDSTVAYNRNIPVCGIASSGWEEFFLTQTEDLEPGDTYRIFVLYKGDILSPGYFSWDRSPTDEIPGNSITNDGTSTHDFVFKTYGDSTCEIEYICDETGNSVFMVRNDCIEQWMWDCPAGCVDGACTTPSAPSLSLDDMYLTDADYNIRYSFSAGETVRLRGYVTSNNGVTGSYDVEYFVFDSAGQVDHAQETRTAPRIGEGDSLTHIYTIPADGAGSYEARITINNCAGVCDQSKSFTVSAQCIDADDDGYHANCGEEDCDDGEASINPGAIEVCDDGIDNNCNGQTDECAPTEPQINAYDILIANWSGSQKTKFSPGEKANFGLCTTNNGAAGTYTKDINVLSGPVEKLSDSVQKSLGAGQSHCTYYAYTIPQDWDGQYKYTAGVSHCSAPDTCFLEMLFDVELVCVDNDGDGYHANCGDEDCDDTDPDVHPGAEEVINNGIDDDCVGGDQEITCGDNWDNCNDDWSDGCETDLFSTDEHCGICDNACDSYHYCYLGECAQRNVPNMTVPEPPFVTVTPDDIVVYEGEA